MLLGCLPVFSQGSAGRILGSITDQSGGAIAGATVTVTDVQRGVTRTLTTDEAGEYLAPDLLPGTYAVRATATGFKTVERPGLLLEVKQDIRVDLTLQPGDQAQTVTVTEEAPQIETTNATLGGTLSNEAINDLPLNGRNYQNLLVLRPGMMIYPGGGGWTQSTDGIRPEDNQYIVDGLTNDNPLTGLTIINGPGVAGDAATILPIDGIQEVNILENPPAEYGGKPGGVVTVGIKSGTNSIHGTAYAFGRDTGFDARNYFNPPPAPKREVGLEQYGVTIGGPIKKDKLFYFLGYEAESYDVGNTNLASVPEALPQPGANNGCTSLTTGDCANSLPDAISDLIANGVQLSALSLKLAGCTPPAAGTVYTCTGGLFPTNTGSSPSFTQGFPDTFRSDNGVAKIDYHINDHHTLNGMYFQSVGTITAEDVIYLQPQWLSHQINTPKVFGIDETWVPNSRWVNDARFGYVNMDRNNKTLDQSTPASDYGIYTGVTNPVIGSLPQIHIKGFTNLGGSPGWPSLQGPAVVYQFVDYVSYLHGNHAIKFGGEIRHNGVDVGAYGGSKGAIKFNGGTEATPLEDFLAGFPSIASIQLGSPQRHLTTWEYALSVQDDWRLTPKVTVNLGLRYDYITPLRESNDFLGNFDPAVGLLQVGKQISSPYNGDHKDFGPRLGVAWDLSGKGTTVVRAGASVIFDSQLPMFVFSNISGNAQNGTAGGVITVPTGAAQITCPASCMTPSSPTFGTPVTVAGTGTVAVSSVTVPASSLVPSWQNNGPNNTIFPPASTPIQCGDGLTPPATIQNPNPVSDPNPCNISAIDRNFRNPYVVNWTLGIQHAFTPNLSLDVAYVGNHGARLPGMRDINQGVPNAASVASGTPTGQPYATQYPYLGFIDMLSNLYVSNYNGLQTTLTERTSHGLSFTFGYTYSHALDNDSYNISPFLPQDSTHPEREYASSDFDLRHRFTFSLTYAFPGVKSPAQLLEGWSINSIVTWQTGEPWIVDDFSDNLSGTSEFADRWDFFGNPSDFKSGNSSIPFCNGSGAGGCTQTTPAGAVSYSAAQSSAFFGACQAAAAKVDGSANGPTTTSLNTLGCYAQGNSVMIPPAAGTFGTMGRNIFRDSGFRNWDLSVTKQVRFGERLNAQFRAEFFNILNHPNFTNPYGASSAYGIGSFADPSQTSQFGCGCATPDQAAGNPVLGSGGNRAMQLGLKLIF
ncbi:MAG TPA: TonB-dependent receptor [Candidatus Acidoferrales bacterium]|nr:TonB-dependent receptor [Candidatus Acidoferrales bacterium]